MLNRDTMLEKVIGDTQERKGELVVVACTAPIIRELASSSYITSEEALRLLQALAGASAPEAATLVLSPKVAEYVEKLGLLKYAEKGLVLADKTIGAYLDAKEAVKAKAHDVKTVVVEALGGQVPPRPLPPQLPVPLAHRAVSIAASAAPQLASLVVGEVSSRASHALFKAPTSKFAQGVSNQLVNTGLASYVVPVVANAIRVYLAPAVVQATPGVAVTTGVAALPVATALVALTFAGIVLKGLAYSVARQLEQSQLNREEERRRIAAPVEGGPVPGPAPAPGDDDGDRRDRRDEGLRYQYGCHY